MNPYDLAWKGVTIEQKTELLNRSLSERERLIKEGKFKDGQLGLASTCVDIIVTAQSVLKENQSPEWQKLLDEAMSISKEAVNLAEEKDGVNWSALDYEVAGVIYLKIKEITKAEELFEKGLDVAIKTDDGVEKLLISGQMIRCNIEKNDAEGVAGHMLALDELIKKEKGIEAKNLTRIYRSLAEGAKFLAIHFAKEAGSENQELKARGI